MLPFLFFLCFNGYYNTVEQTSKSYTLFFFASNSNTRDSRGQLSSLQVFLKPCLIRHTLEWLSLWSNVMCWWHAYKAGRAATLQSLQQAGVGVTTHCKQHLAPLKRKQVSPLKRFIISGKMMLLWQYQILAGNKTLFYISLSFALDLCGPWVATFWHFFSFSWVTEVH